MEDESRREAAGVPEEVEFATKGELARKMLERAFAAEVPASWVTADARSTARAARCAGGFEARGRSHVLAVSRSHPLPRLPLGSRRAEEIVAAEAPPEASWERVEVGAGSKGMRLYEWARARLAYLTEEGRAQWLLVRRCSASSPEEMAYYRAYAPEEAPLAGLARVEQPRVGPSRSASSGQRAK